MKTRHILSALLVAFGLAACGGGNPAASDADLSPRFDASGQHGSGNGGRGEESGGVMSNDPTPPPPPPTDTTSLIGGGWIGSGT